MNESDLKRDVLTGELTGEEEGHYEAPVTPDQGSLFDLGALTVEAPDADVMRAMDEMGYSPEARLKIFEDATIKQMVFYFRGDEYRLVVERMGRVLKATGVKDHTRGFLALLDHFENGKAQA